MKGNTKLSKASLMGAIALLPRRPSVGPSAALQRHTRGQRRAAEQRHCAAGGGEGPGAGLTQSVTRGCAHQDCVGGITECCVHERFWA